MKSVNYVVIFREEGDDSAEDVAGLGPATKAYQACRIRVWGLGFSM